MLCGDKVRQYLEKVNSGKGHSLPIVLLLPSDLNRSYASGLIAISGMITPKNNHFDISKALQHEV